MDNINILRSICRKAADGEISPKDFYGRLSEMAASENDDSDLACLLEDAMMDLEMDGSPGAARATAKGITEELDGHF